MLQQKTVQEKREGLIEGNGMKNDEGGEGQN